MPQFAAALEKCHDCTKTVYLTEKIVVDDKEDKRTYHKMCFRCSHCKKTLSLGNYASMGGIYYCKPHFKQLFATKGNYDEGFGKDKLTAKWAPSAAPATSAAVSFVPVDSTTDSKSEKKEVPASVASRFKKPETTSSSSSTTTPSSFVPVESTSVQVEKKETPAHVAARFKKPETTSTTSNSFVPVEATTTPTEKKETPAHVAARFKKPEATSSTSNSFVPVEATTTQTEKKETPAHVAARFKKPAGAAMSGFVPVESTSTGEKKEASPSVTSRFKSNADKCTGCGKTVYATERIAVEDKDDKKVFHKTCLKCSHCNKVLSLGNYAGMGGKFYCKPHFKQLFATKGNYDEGFGKQQHKAKWIQQEDEPTPISTSASSSFSEPREEERVTEHVKETREEDVVEPKEEKVEVETEAEPESPSPVVATTDEDTPALARDEDEPKTEERETEHEREREEEEEERREEDVDEESSPPSSRREEDEEEN